VELFLKMAAEWSSQSSAERVKCKTQNSHPYVTIPSNNYLFLSTVIDTRFRKDVFQSCRMPVATNIYPDVGSYRKLIKLRLGDDNKANLNIDENR
jgi:hypothetical protein